MFLHGFNIVIEHLWNVMRLCKSVILPYAKFSFDLNKVYLPRRIKRREKVSVSRK